MRNWTTATALTVWMTGVAAIAADGPAELVIRDVAVVDLAAGVVRPGQDLVVRGPRIVQVSPTGGTLPAAKTTVQGRGKVALPGLIDGRVDVAAVDAAAAQGLLSWGVTGLGDSGRAGARLAIWQRDLASGRIYAPRASAACQGGGATSGTSTAGVADAVHGALAALVARGRTPLQALRAFTVDNARALCLDGVGEIAVGNSADLLVLTGNPLIDIAQTRAIDAVVFRGEVLTQAHVQMLRRGVLPAPTPSR